MDPRLVRGATRGVSLDAERVRDMRLLLHKINISIKKQFASRKSVTMALVCYQIAIMTGILRNLAKLEDSNFTNVESQTLPNER